MAVDISQVGIQFVSAGYEKVAGEMENLEQKSGRVERAYSGVGTASNQLAGQLARLASTIVSVYGAYRAFETGWRFNQVMESSMTSLTGLLASLYEYRNATGKVTTGVEAFNLAQKDAAKLQQDLRIAGLKTAATYEELQGALGQAFNPAKEAGVALENMVAFTTRFVQVATAANVPLNQLGEEMRSFLQATMQSRTTRVMPFMTGIGLSNEKVKELLASGKLYEEFMKRSEQLQIAAERASRGWTVSLSNAKDAIQNLLGAGFVGSFESIKGLFIDIADYIVKIDNAAGTVELNPTLVKALRDVDGILVSIIDGFKRAAAGASEFSSQHPTLTGIAGDLTKMGIAILAVVGGFGVLRTIGTYVLRFFATNFAAIGGYVGSVVGALGTLGAALTGLSGAAATLAGVIIAALAGIVLYFTSDWFRSMVDGIAAWVGEFQIGSWKVKDYFTIVAIAVKDVWNSVSTWFSEWYARLSPETKAIVESIKDAWDATVKFFKDMWYDAVNIVLDWWKKLKDAASFVVDITLSDKAKEEIQQAKRQADLYKEMQVEGAAFEQFSGGGTIGGGMLGKPKPTAKPGGEGSGKDTEKQVMSFLQALDKELARMSGSGWRELEQWYASQLDRIREIAPDVKTSLDLQGRLFEVYTAKRQDLERQFNEWYAENTFNRTAMLEAALQEDLRKWGNTEEKKTQIREAHNMRRQMSDDELRQNELQMRQQQLQAMAQLVPSFQQQYAIEKQLLAIENELADLALKKFLTQNNDLNPAVKEELKWRNEILKGLREEELRRKNLMKMGERGGAQAWAEDRLKAMQERQGKFMYDLLTEAEQQMSSTLADAFWNALQGTPSDWTAVGEQLAQQLNRKVFEYLTAKLFDQLIGPLKAGGPVKPTGGPGDPIYTYVTNMGVGGQGGDILSWLRGANVPGGQAGWMYQSTGQQVGPQFSAYLDAEAQMTGEMAAAKQASTGFFSSITSFFSSIWQTASGWLGKLGSVISDFFSSIWNFFSGTGGTGGAGGAGGGGIGSMFSSVFSWVGGLFGFQHGGIAYSPMVAKLAEYGKPEAVVPLRQGAIPVRWTAREKGGDSGQKRLVNVNISINTPDARGFFGSETQMMAKIGKAVQKALQKDM